LDGGFTQGQKNLMKKQFALALALAVAPFAASADALSYTFVEGGYTKLHIDADLESNPEADGPYLRGSIDLGSGINLIGSVQQVSDSGSIEGIRYEDELMQSELGVGYHQSMSERVDFIAELAWVRLDAESSFDGEEWIDVQGTGGRVALGLRGRLNGVVDGLLKVNYYDGSDLDGEFTAVVGAQFKINPTWGITAEIENGDVIGLDTTRYNVGVRASF
jgi:hypothetical protein